MTGEEPWPSPQPLLRMVQDHFDFLVRDHGFVRRPTAPPVAVYDLDFMQTLTRVAVGLSLESFLLDVFIGWPTERMAQADPEPVISLADIVAMRAPKVDLPRDVSTEDAAR